METTTTRSQPRRRKVGQDLVGTVPWTQPVTTSVTHSQVEGSTTFPGGLTAGHGPSAGTAVVKRCLQASTGQSVILVGAGGAGPKQGHLCVWGAWP